MGAEIEGWVQIRNAELDEEDFGWLNAIQVGSVAERCSHMFGALFGVRNRSGFQPAAAMRGLPTFVSEQIWEEAQATPAWASTTDYHSHSWITWAEIRAMDWEQTALLVQGSSPGEMKPSLQTWLSGTVVFTSGG